MIGGLIALSNGSWKFCWLLAFLIACTGLCSGEEHPVNYELIVRGSEHFVPVATCGPLLIGVLDAQLVSEIGTGSLIEKAEGVFYIIDLWTVNMSGELASLSASRIQLIDESSRTYHMSETAILTSMLSSSAAYSHITLFLDLDPNIQYIIRLIFDVDREFDPSTAKLGIAPGKWGSAEEYFYIWARKMLPADFI